MGGATAGHRAELMGWVPDEATETRGTIKPLLTGLTVSGVAAPCVHTGLIAANLTGATVAIDNTLLTALGDTSGTFSRTIGIGSAVTGDGEFTSIVDTAAPLHAIPIQKALVAQTSAGITARALCRTVSIGVTATGTSHTIAVHAGFARITMVGRQARHAAVFNAVRLILATSLAAAGPGASRAIAQATDSVDLQTGLAGTTGTILPTAPLIQLGAKAGGRLAVELGAAISVLSAAITNGSATADGRHTNKVAWALRMSRTLNIVLDADTETAGLALSTVLVHLTGLILADTVACGAGRAQRTLAVMLALWCTGQHRRHKSKPHKHLPNPVEHRWFSLASWPVPSMPEPPDSGEDSDDARSR